MFIYKASCVCARQRLEPGRAHVMSAVREMYESWAVRSEDLPQGPALPKILKIKDLTMPRIYIVFIPAAIIETFYKRVKVLMVDEAPWSKLCDAGVAALVWRRGAGLMFGDDRQLPDMWAGGGQFKSIL